jgi:hypothetical protein
LTAEHGDKIGVSPEELAQRFPRLYHMAEAGTWESIRRHGLLSTSALLDLFEVEGAERQLIESERRPESVSVSHSEYGTAVIRDQKPMREAALASCLTDMTMRQWYETLNRRVFFWLTRERLTKLLTARAYRGKMHCVLTVDTELLAKRHREQITLSPINSGSTIYKPVRRGSATFLSLNAYPYEARRKSKGWKNVAAELAVDYAIPDIEELVIRVDHMIGARTVKKIYER